MTPKIAPGRVVGGKYRVERVIGDGGMGVVVEATHLAIGTRVALKLLAPDAHLDATATARLVREARATAKIGDAHVARVFDVDTDESGAPYIVMELLEGSDLGALARARGRLSVADAVRWVAEGCVGVARAHALGIVHRDLKPSNLFLARDALGRRSVKVLDFGLSMITEVGARSRTERLTGTNSLLGSPVYMSPEQIDDPRAVDARADVWSLGVILYELLTGRFPFEGTTLPNICTLILHARPPAIGAYRPDVPTGLVAVIERCLEKDPAERYADAGALARALAPFAPAAASRVESRAPRRATIGALVVAAAAIVAVALSAAFHARAPRTSPRASAPPVTVTSCDTCVATNCSTELRACRASEACAGALEAYDACAATTDRSSAAACSERLGTSPDPQAQRLAECVFVRLGGATVGPGPCAGACAGKPIGAQACAGYCACMSATCSFTLAPSACAATCAALTPEQVRCRSFHCALAGQGQPEVHCRHAVGELGMCP